MFEIGISIQWNYTKLKVKFNIFNRAVASLIVAILNLTHKK